MSTLALIFYQLCADNLRIKWLRALLSIVDGWDEEKRKKCMQCFRCVGTAKITSLSVRLVVGRFGGRFLGGRLACLTFRLRFIIWNILFGIYYLDYGIIFSGITS